MLVPRRIETVMEHRAGTFPRDPTYSEIHRSKEANDQYEAMQPWVKIPNSPHQDHRGHLIACMFGGPAAWWNVAPMSRALNLGNGQRGLNWSKMENRIITHLTDHACLSVRWRLDIVYPQYWPDQRRPGIFYLSVMFEQMDGSVQTYVLRCINNEAGECSTIYEPGWRRPITPFREGMADFRALEEPEPMEIDPPVTGIIDLDPMQIVYMVPPRDDRTTTEEPMDRSEEHTSELQ